MLQSIQQIQAKFNSTAFLLDYIKNMAGGIKNVVRVNLCSEIVSQEFRKNEQSQKLRFLLYSKS